MKLWISGGGTGGHVYPALAVLDALGDRAENVLWLGRHDGIEADIVKRFGIPFEPVRTGPVVGAGVFGALRGGVRIGVGALRVAHAMRIGRPDAVLVTGGYVSMPVAIAARIRRVPLAMYLPDARPGRAAAWIARLADRIFVTHPDVSAFVGPRKAVVTGYPVRAGLRGRSRDAARRALGIAADRPLVLVFGGSQGARRINEATADAAATLLQDVDIIHITGAIDHAAARERATRIAPGPGSGGYHLYSYLHDAEMLDALAAADLVISRAGAAVLGEYPARGLPSILIPLPISRGHQWANARLLQAAGAAITIPDHELDGPRLIAEILALVQAPGALERMGRAAAGLDRPNAAEGIAVGLLALARSGSAA